MYAPISSPSLSQEETIAESSGESSSLEAPIPAAPQVVVSPKKSFDMALFALCCCNAVDAVETLAFGSVLAVYVHPETHRRIDQDALLSGLLTISVFVGMLLGGLVAGFLADSWGRKPVLLSCMILNAISALLAAWTHVLKSSTQVYLLAFFRFVGGLGVGGSVPCVFALVAELTSPLTQTRGQRVTLLATAWSVGSLFTSTAAWWVLDQGGANWPRFFVWCSVPAWISVWLTWWAVKEREFHSAAVLLRNGEVIVHWNLLLAFALVFFAENFGSYGPLTWMNDVFFELGYTDPYLLTLLNALSALLGNGVAFYAMDRVKRKSLLSFSMAIAALAAMVFGVENLPMLVRLGLSCVFSFMLTLSWTALGVMSAEAFPFESRTTHLGMAAAFGRMGSILANAVNPFLLAERLILPIAGVVLLVGALVVVWSLEDSVQVDEEPIDA